MSMLPGLNPIDFSVWSITLKIHHTVDDLKRRVWNEIPQRRAWNEIPQEQLRAASEGVRKRLEAVIESNGGHFE